MAKTVYLNFEKDSKQYRKLEKQAKKSFVPFIVLCALGVSALIIGLTIMSLAVVLEGGIPAAYDDASPRYYLLNALANVFIYAVCLGCLGPGIPLLVITIVNKSKAKKTLALYEEAHKDQANENPVTPSVESESTSEIVETKVEEPKKAPKKTSKKKDE